MIRYQPRQYTGPLAQTLLAAHQRGADLKEIVDAHWTHTSEGRVGVWLTWKTGESTDSDTPTPMVPVITVRCASDGGRITSTLQLEGARAYALGQSLAKEETAR